jgi:HEAT repeat protein
MTLACGFLGLMLITSAAVLPASQAQKSHADLSKSQPQVELLKSSDPKVRARTARDLGKSGDPSVIPALKAALTDSDVHVRHEVVVALASLHSAAALEPLAGATRDSDPGIQTLAIHCLVGYYTGETPEEGFSGFFQKRYSEVKGVFVDEDTRIDPGVVVDPVVLAALENDLRSGQSFQVQREAAKGLGILMAKQAVPDLVKSAHSNDPDVALESLNALRKIKDTSAGPKLLDLLDSRNDDVKRATCVTAGLLHTHDAVAKLQLIYQNNMERKTKEKALEGLGYLAEPVSEPIFNKALWSQDKSYRVSAAEGLGRLGDKKVVPDLQKAEAMEKDGEVRLAMEFALTDLGKDDYLKGMIEDLGTKLHGNTAQVYLIELSRNSAFLPA